MTLQNVTVEAMIKAPVEKVWRYYTEPTHITRWNFAADDWCCPNATNDLRVGGKYLARMEAKDGSFGFDFGAVYEEVVVHKTITYTMGDGRRSTTQFESFGNTTKVTTMFDAESENSIEMQRDGWQAILDNFKTHAERQAVKKNMIYLWYESGAEDAARFYSGIFPESSVGEIVRAPSDSPSGKEGGILTVEFVVAGIPCVGLNGGPHFKQSEAFSFQILTEDQEETDRYWNAIVDNGGKESQCGWCKDKWGVSWQITPRLLAEAMSLGGETAKRAFDAMMPMGKIDVETIASAISGKP